MDENNTNKLFDLGSDPVGEDFDPFASEDDNNAESGINETEDVMSSTTGIKASSEQASETSLPEKPKAATPEKIQTTSTEILGKKTEAKELDFADKLPIFEYAGATESINDISKTFDELRIEKSSDFPELEDGKRVSWTVEYGKINKIVADPKGISIGKMKSDIETSKAFEDNLKKRGADKSPVCKVKPRVTAQSKGQCDIASDCGRKAASYKTVFTNMEEAETAGKVISIVPARDGKVYEIRNNVMGKFITPVVTVSSGGSCDMLSDVRAGFSPALPLIPMDLIMRIVAFFRYYMRDSDERTHTATPSGSETCDREVLVNIYWDKRNKAYVVDVPEQTVTKVSVESNKNLNFDDERYVHYMDIHSHNSMKAFFSAVDDKDEKATRLYTVIGRLDKYFPDVKTRISNGGKFLEINPAEVFELVARPFPEEWKSNVHLKMSLRCGKNAAINDMIGR